MVNNIDGSGNSSTFIDYEFKDYKFTPGVINYYRIKQTDFDGKFEYSWIIYVKNKMTSNLVRTISLDGKEVDKNYRGFVIDWYEDGTYEKRIQLGD